MLTNLVTFCFEKDFSIVLAQTPFLRTGLEGFKELFQKINALPPLQVKWTDGRLIQSNDIV